MSQREIINFNLCRDEQSSHKHLFVVPYKPLSCVHIVTYPYNSCFYRTEMQILSFSFLLYTITGLWRPIEWSSKWSKSLYSVYTFFTLYLFMYFFLTHFLYVIFVVKNLEGLASSFSIFLGTIALLCKAIVIVIRRDRIINLIKILQEEPCKTCNEEEINIQMKFDRLIRSHSMPYIILCTISVIGTIIGGILYMLEGQIPYGFVWVPWECTSFLLFCFTSLQEIAAVVIGIVVNVATETTVLGFCLLICARFEILNHRLQKMIKGEKESIWKSSMNNTSRLSKYVSFHLCIIRLAEMINDVFSPVIFIQFCISILVLCSAAYYLSSNVTLLNVLNFATYVFCLFVQIYVYCWAGNEVTLKSVELGEEIYHMDWILMTRSEQLDLLMMMKRSTKPIKFTSSFLVTLSLESYSNLLKATFSVFNLLQQL